MGEARLSLAPAPEEAGLELERAGTRFRRPEVEAAFLTWQRSRSLAFNRAGLNASIGAWLVGGLTGFVIDPNSARLWIAMTALVLGAIAVALVACHRPGLAAFAQPLTALANTVAGVTLVGLLDLHLARHATSMAGVGLVNFFGFAILRVRPWQAMLAVAPYVVLQVVVAVGASGTGDLAFADLVMGLVLITIAYASGALIAIVTDVIAHDSYRQERIIAAQRETIARERAKNEAQLRAELSHQIAERSRELGAVLAKADVTLDVRHLSPGERFDARYRIVSALGAGGMGAVYEVERVRDSQRLALKVVVGEVSGAGAARFAREAEIGARVHHASLVSIVDVGVSAGVPFLVMELVGGGSLEAQRARFGDVEWALPILRQIAEGLQALHEAGVVHRDLKPANVLLAEATGRAPTAKISDFGISRFGAPDDARSEAGSVDPHAATMGVAPSPRSSALTGTGVVLGTPLYMAPEAARGGRALDGSADVFALGILAYELLTGRAPFSVPPMLLALAEQPIPVPAAIEDARVPAALRSRVLECLRATPSERPRVAALLDAIVVG